MAARLLNLPEKIDNDTIIPNSEDSIHVVKEILGEYKIGFIMTNPKALEINILNI